MEIRFAYMCLVFPSRFSHLLVLVTKKTHDFSFNKATLKGTRDYWMAYDVRLKQDALFEKKTSHKSYGISFKNGVVILKTDSCLMNLLE